MMPLVFSVQQDDPVREAASLMTVEQIHRVIVLDGKRLVGILSASDIAAAVGRGELVERYRIHRASVAEFAAGRLSRTGTVAA